VQFFSAFIAICSVLAAHVASAGELKIPKIDAAEFSGARPLDPAQQRRDLAIDPVLADLGAELYPPALQIVASVTSENLFK
jgi:hypothetical protein